MAAPDGGHHPDALRTIPQQNLERINILLKEYDTLRSEILQRTAAGFALPAVFSGIAGWLLSRIIEHHDCTSAIVALSGAILLVGAAIWVWKFVNTQIRWCAARVRRIENRINFLTQDHLLEWESRWGIGATGHHWFAEDFPPDLHESQRFPIDSGR